MFISLGSLDHVVHYFKDTFIGRSRNRRVRLAPLFPSEVWSMHDRNFSALTPLKWLDSLGRLCILFSIGLD